MSLLKVACGQREQQHSLTIHYALFSKVHLLLRLVHYIIYTNLKKKKRFCCKLEIHPVNSEC